jgi:hypothetical protein
MSPAGPVSPWRRKIDVLGTDAGRTYMSGNGSTHGDSSSALLTPTPSVPR